MHASDRSLRGGTIADLRRMEQDPQHGYAAIVQHGVIGRGLNNYDAIFSTLRGAGFHGWVSIEDGMNGMEELRLSADFLREKIHRHFSTGSCS
jgi:sugar phosphate isomerase/epimerase